MNRSVSLLSLLLLLAPAFAQNAEAVDRKQLRKEADAAVQAGKFDVATTAFRKLTASNPQDADAWHMLGYSLHAAGKLDEALPIHLKAAEFPATAAAASYNVACVHALKGHTDDAITWLDKAVARGFGDADLLAKDTDLASVRTDARFVKLQEALAAKAAAHPGLVAFAQTTERRSVRVLWFDKKGSPGEIALDFGPVPWNDEYEQALAAGKFKDKKWRLGGDFWTSLDTSVDLKFGGVTVPAGYWYLTLEQRDSGYVLAAHDAAAVRKQKVDAVFANVLKGGIEIPLAHAAADRAATLDIGLRPEGGSKTDGMLRIRFGPHELSAPVSMQLD